MQHQNKSLSMLDEILEDVRKAADRLEEEIEEHAFDDNKSVSSIPDNFLITYWATYWKNMLLKLFACVYFCVDWKTDTSVL